MDKERIEDHYLITLYELENGATLDELRQVIKEYESIEDYEVCAGIYNAIQMVSFHTLTNLSKQLDSKIRLRFKK